MVKHPDITSEVTKKRSIDTLLNDLVEHNKPKTIHLRAGEARNLANIIDRAQQRFLIKKHDKKKDEDIKEGDMPSVYHLGTLQENGEYKNVATDINDLADYVADYLILNNALYQKNPKTGEKLREFWEMEKEAARNIVWDLLGVSKQKFMETIHENQMDIGNLKVKQSHETWGKNYSERHIVKLQQQLVTPEREDELKAYFKEHAGKEGVAYNEKELTKMSFKDIGVLLLDYKNKGNTFKPFVKHEGYAPLFYTKPKESEGYKKAA